MLRFLEKMKAKSDDLFGAPGVTAAFLGDSVTQGCFEIYRTGEQSIETMFDSNAAYSADFRSILATLYPRVPLGVFNCGISGDSAPGGAKRLERDVLVHRPDLVVVSYGLNDACGGLGKLPAYTAALHEIFARLAAEGIDAVYLTENRMCRYVDCRIGDDLIRRVAGEVADVQNNGVLDAYFAAGIEAAKAEGALVCDCYSAWQRLEAAGVDTTYLLANHVNHPPRELHWLFAWALVQTLLGA